MNRFLVILLFGAVIISACGSQGNDNQASSNKSEAQGDWPALSLEEMMEKSDLIAFVTVANTEKANKSNGLNVQISTLDVNEAISGSAPEAIKLDQAMDYVKKGRDYLIFLTYNENGYYYVVNPSGVIQEQNGVYNGEKLDTEGQLTKEEVKKLLLNKM